MRAMSEKEIIGCDICKSRKYSLVFVGRDNRFGYKEEFTFVKCENCGLIYLNPRPSLKQIKHLYEKEYTPEGWEMIVRGLESPRWENVRKLWHKVNGNYSDCVIEDARGTVLEIGCGSGEKFLSVLKRKGCEVFGVEINDRYVEMHEKRGLNVFYGSLEEAKFPYEHFDTVIMSQVIEHLPSPKQTLIEIRRILKQEGRILIYCPNADGYLRSCFGKYWHGWHIPFHFFVFSNRTISKLAKDVGFTVSKISGLTPDDFFTTSLKSYLFSDKDGIRPVDRGRFIDSIAFRAIVAPLLRLLDYVLKGREDCLGVELTKS